MFNCHECHLFEINTLWESVLPQSTHPTLIQNTRGKSFTFTASWMSCFPQHPGLSRLDRLVQNSLPKIYKYCGSVLIRPRFFWFDEFIKLVALPSSRMSGLWWTFGFKTSSTESLWTYLYQFPKRSMHQIMSTPTGINKTRYNSQTASRFRQDIKIFSLFCIIA